MSAAARQVIVHGHFYQPPREEPWLDLVPREPSAAPDHDWNERITAQCYAPLARGRVFDERGRLVRLVNSFAWCSFDIGPTLFRWFDQHAPDVGAAIVTGDRASAERLGAGNAMAMPYHHVILPLLSRRDKITEVRWGVRDFRARFGREPEGMWLPETAVDEETLEVLADERIRFTVLAPQQVAGWPPFGRPGRWRGTGGREVALFIYDGPASHHVAFGDALDDAARWETGFATMALADDGGPTVISIATDGETYGHHHRNGDLALASLIDRVSRGTETAFTNYATLLAVSPPAHDLELVSPSAWSCPHGVGRWEEECGCCFEPGTQQQWRMPLREGLSTLRDGATAAVQELWPAAGGDIWTARDVAGPDLASAPQLDPAARVLLEIEEHLLAMFTSCAWFFDDIGRVEPLIVLRHAARVLELLPPAVAAPLEAQLVATLAYAISNDPAKGNGADIWRRDALPGAERVGNLAAAVGALRALAPTALEEPQMPAHRWQVDDDDVILEERRTGLRTRWRVDTTTPGVVPIHAMVRALPGSAPRAVTLAGYPEPFRRLLQQLATPIILDAALSSDDATALRAGLLDAPALRSRALAGAWALVRRDGLDAAGIVVHGALDLYDLAAVMVPDTERSEALRQLADAPLSPVRDSLMERFGLA
jgi:hypothetical protein